MLGETFPTIITTKKHLLLLQRYFAYYRFHKRVGKGSWIKYIERYKVPRSIENTQRLIYNYKPTFTESKLSACWLWNLPKRIALATTTDEVLNVWVYYRHKRKKAYHFLKVLKRLVEIGHCPTSDWRFKLITTRIENKINTFLNLPRICFYYGKLKATAQLETLSKMIYRRLHGYPPNQLLLILRGFSLCHLQDKYLFNEIKKLLLPSVPFLPFYYLSTVVESYSSCLIYDYLFLSTISDEILYRLQLCVSSNHTDQRKLKERVAQTVEQEYGSENENESEVEIEIDETKKMKGTVGLFGRRLRKERVEKEGEPEYIEKTKCNIDDTDEALIKYKQDQFNYYPTLKNLIHVGYYFANLKFQHYPFYEQISILIKHMLETQNGLNPYLIEYAVYSFYKLKINDIILLEYILKHIDIFMYDYPPRVLCSIGFYCSSMLPTYYAPLFAIFRRMILYVKNHISILEKNSLSNLACFVHKVKNLDMNLRKETLRLINAEVKKERFSIKEKKYYDLPRLMEILSYHKLLDTSSFSRLCIDIHSHIEYFEPCDFNRMIRSLQRAFNELQLQDDNVLNALARNVIKQKDLFHIIDYHQIVKMLLTMNTIKDIYKIYLIKHHMNLPFYNFESLALDHVIPKEEKKSLRRYKKGTIYFSNKIIQQEYPLYKALEN